MKTFVVTTADDSGAGGLSLREAVGQAQAAKGPTLITFAKSLAPNGAATITLKSALEVKKGDVTIDGDINGDGILDIYLQADNAANTHHLTVRSAATVTLKDVALFGGGSFTTSGTIGASKPGFVPKAGDGADGVQQEVAAGASQQAIAAKAALLPKTLLDGGNGMNGTHGERGDDGGRGQDAAGSIVNEGKLTLVRTGFYANDAVAGDGADGGNGGRGQDGGDGGDGAVGAVRIGGKTSKTFAGTVGAVDSGRGGDAGDGGDGGGGGTGGRGGDAAGAVFNRDGGSLTLVDVAFGGRLASGMLIDRFGNDAFGGNGGKGGNGGIGGSGGGAGWGGDDVQTVLSQNAKFLNEVYNLTYNPATGEAGYNYIWFGIIETRKPGDPLTSRAYSERAKADGRHVETTEAGIGGRGGDAGDGGSAGGNGAGGHAAVVVNYGVVTGNGAFGKGNSVKAGDGDPSDFYDFVGNPGTAGRSTIGGEGGDETVENFWTLRPVSYVLGANESWASSDPHTIGEHGTTGTGYAYVVDLPAKYDMPDPAVSGPNGLAGVKGTDGRLGKTGQESKDVVSEGKAVGLEREAGLVYLTGVRQDEDFGQLLFNVVRVGDTSRKVTITYEIAGMGGSGLAKADLAKPKQLTGKIVFKPIDQENQTFDTAGSGIARIAIDLKADGRLEGGEGFSIVLKSKDAALGTNAYSGDLYDGDYNRVDGSRGNDAKLNGTGKDDVIFGLEGDDRIKAKAGHDIALGGEGNDRVDGNAGNDRLEGGGGDDQLDGGDGEDLLLGGDGKDVLKGGAGKDLIVGGLGADTSTGGAGADTFLFEMLADSTVAKAGRDTILDFSKDQKDRIDVAAIDANLRKKGDQAFAFIGGKAFSKKGGELRVEKSKGTTFVYGDVDGDRKADFAILLDGVHKVKATDFEL